LGTSEREIRSQYGLYASINADFTRRGTMRHTGRSWSYKRQSSRLNDSKKSRHRSTNIATMWSPPVWS